MTFRRIVVPLSSLSSRRDMSRYFEGFYIYIELQAQINYKRCVWVLLFYLNFVVTSTGLGVLLVFYLIGCEIGFCEDTCVYMII